VLAALVAFGCAATKDQALVITAEQYDAVEASGVDEEPAARGRVDPDAPVIIVETPETDSDVSTPFSVRVRFEPLDGATIDLDTLKIKYHIFDLTDEVLENMTVTGSGIVGEIDAIKPGRYKLKLSISDDRQRTGRATLRFHIVSSLD